MVVHSEPLEWWQREIGYLPTGTWHAISGDPANDYVDMRSLLMQDTNPHHFVLRIAITAY